MNRLLVVLMLAVPAPAAASVGDAFLFLGHKTLNEDDWSPVERQGEAGLDFDFRGEDWPVSLAFGLRGSGAKATRNLPAFGRTDITGRTSEVRFGVRKIWSPGPRFHPYLGGGLALIGAEAIFENSSGRVSDSDDGGGAWLGGGFFFTLGGSFDIGLDISASGGTAKLFGADVKSGGGHGGLFIGYHWGG